MVTGDTDEGSILVEVNTAENRDSCRISAGTDPQPWHRQGGNSSSGGAGAAPSQGCFGMSSSRAALPWTPCVGHCDTAARKCSSSALRGGHKVLPHRGTQHRNGRFLGNGQRDPRMLLGQSHLGPGGSPAQQHVGIKPPLSPAHPSPPEQGSSASGHSLGVSGKFSTPQFPAGLSSHSLATAQLCPCSCSLCRPHRAPSSCLLLPAVSPEGGAEAGRVAEHSQTHRWHSSS